MVFFNYATMQMAAKIVYYGPGLCGKTTNLHIIYGRTSPKARGEMVSLETETDRTLFFDLLPLDVGVIGGFKTRLQLYTVPGQVFYNTTRKLVLKGVDGIVFVADSQRPMLESNRGSLKNLSENLAEIGLQLADIPLVYQYNKRDLSNIFSVDELNAALNPDRSIEWHEASAANGVGVFETLKGISKLTLKVLRTKMTGDMKKSTVIATPATPASVPVLAPTERNEKGDKSAVQRAAEAGRAASGETMARLARFSEIAGATGLVVPAKPAPSSASIKRAPEESRASAVATPPSSPSLAPPGMSPPPSPPLSSTVAVPRLRSADEEAPADISFGENEASPPAAAAAVAAVASSVKHVQVRSSVDILSELDKLRKLSTQKPTGQTAAVAALGASAMPKPSPALNRSAVKSSVAASLDDLLSAGQTTAAGRREVSKSYDIGVPRDTLARSRQLTLSVSLKDEAGQLPGGEKSVSIELSNPRDIQKLLVSLRLNFQVE